MKLETVVCSEIRSKIMKKLLSGSIRLTELCPGTKKQNVNFAIQPLLGSGLVVSDEGMYSLTGPGRGMALVLQDALAATEVLSDRFWHTHDLSGIPDDLLKRIGDLSGGKVVCPNDDILKAQHNFIELVTNAKEVWGVSSVFMQEWPEMILEAHRRGAEVHLILSPDICQKLPREFLGAGLDLYFRPCRAAFTVADNTLSLGLFVLGGGYDPTQDFICESEKAATWGKALYQHCL